MTRRMDRYHEEEQAPKTRVSRNEFLYDDLNTKIGYEEVIDLNTQTKIDLNLLNQKAKSREEYQQIRDYKEFVPHEEPKEKEKVKEEPRNFDINEVLEQAKKNRKEVDELEKRRNLKDDEYSVLSSLNKKYLHRKEPTPKEEEELKELIDTITSSTLREEIKKKQEEEKLASQKEMDEEDDGKDLLSDLLATKTEINLQEELAKEILKDSKKTEDTSSDEDEEEDEEENTEEEEKKEETKEDTYEPFFTKSMDLSNHDFEFKDEIEQEGKVGRRILIGFVIFVLFALILILVYLILNHLGIQAS